MMNHREGMCAVCGAEGTVFAAAGVDDPRYVCPSCFWDALFYAAGEARAQRLAREVPPARHAPKAKK